MFSQTLPCCTNTSKTTPLFILILSPYHFHWQSSSATYTHQTILVIIHSFLTTTTMDTHTIPFHPHHSSKKVHHHVDADDQPLIMLGNGLTDCIYPMITAC